MATQTTVDVVVLGGGAAGLFAAAIAAQRGRRVAVLEVSNKFGKKILMSGGGRCNFTNLDVSADNFICPNPHFVKSALAQYTNWDFIGLVAKHGVAYHEKAHGQLFADESAKLILNMLLDECRAVNVGLHLNCDVTEVTHNERYEVTTNIGQFACQSLIVATGGLSIPTLGGATGLGYRLAQQFGLAVNQTEASLVPFTLSGVWHELAESLSGVALPVRVSAYTRSFFEDMLFTHRGLSGPAVLQLSNYWHLGDAVTIDLLPNTDLQESLPRAKRESPQKKLQIVLSQWLPKSVVQALAPHWWPGLQDKPLQEISFERLQTLAEQCHAWEITPSGTEGYRTAEVTRGGVDVRGLSSQTMQVAHQPGLFFIGEVLDVTGHLGGYNFQWAWSSGYVAGNNA
ncbi:hypothetical protein GCM10008090_17510 [Arenicella chitinivorans]|uniref:NAD(P)/FAD-dependent oxidoreductase n=2 Tax=Arenicella chitinivorans TaxID=1329800 RepID=A0A918VME9_9GAMM|nr:NAD(P)/FAD-dependent oxidoreductase [Arenicella chitinivorans]GHA08165.1 hypothetical protein GCM10008090_17510 [Arenicella chitinivorans]